MPPIIATAPVSWGVWFGDDPRQIPWHRYLDEAVEAGFEWTELGPPGYLPGNPRSIQREVERRGLKVCGQFVMKHFEDAAIWSDIEAEFNSVGDRLARLGGTTIVLIDDLYQDPFTGALTGPKSLSEKEWVRLIDVVDKLGRSAKERFGLTDAIHGHLGTHVESEDELVRLLGETDSDSVKICFDTGHFACTGADPIPFLKEYYDRVTYFHFKNIDPKVHQKMIEQNLSFAAAVAAGLFCEPATGEIDFRELGQVLTQNNFDGFVVFELDMYPAPFDKPLPIAKRARSQFRELGLG